MGQRLAKLVLLTTSLGGCSLLYDPSGLPPAADAMIPPPDVSPCDMTVTDVAPTTLVEGTGEGGSRPALIVISGTNLVSNNTTILFTPVAGSTRTAQIAFDHAKIEVGAYGEQLALPVTLPVAPMLRANETITLDVTVEQDCAERRVSAMLLGKLTLKGLDELTSATAPLEGGLHEYSRIDVATGTLAYPSDAIPTSPIILRSTSSVKIANSILLDAMERIGGAAGGTGGVGGSAAGGNGTPGTGPNPGQPPGGPGGFDTTDPGLNTLSNPNGSSGGAGGAGAVAGTGGDGGGGGGSIEITAGGDLQVSDISAHGAAGKAGGGVGGTAGGGGSGGVILLRAGAALTAGKIDVSGGGTGAAGRARYDAGGAATVPEGSFGTAHLRGPMFARPPFAVRSPRPDLMVVGKPLSAFKYFFIKPGGGVSALSGAVFGADGTATVSPQEDLVPGANEICLVTDSGTTASETRNCVSIAYLR
jgi:hypothetical protein